MADTLKRLETIIASRWTGDPSQSYVAHLMAKGRAKIAQKVGEEAVETVIAAMAGDHADLSKEAADLLFHLAMLLADAGLSFDDVFAELDARDGVSGLTEKAARKDR